MKSTTWTTRPSSASGAQRNRSVAESVEPAAEQVAGDDPDRDRVQDEHRPRTQPGCGRPPRIASSCADVLARGDATTNRSTIAATVISPSAGMQARPSPARPASSVARRWRPALEPDVDAGEQLADGQRPVAADERDPDGVACRPARTAPAPAAPARIRSTSPSQYGSISARWASTSRGPQRRLGIVVEAVGERPRRPGLDRRAGARRGAGRPPSSRCDRGRRRSCAQCGTRGRSMDGQDHRSARGSRVAADRPARSTGDPR